MFNRASGMRDGRMSHAAKWLLEASSPGGTMPAKAIPAAVTLKEFVANGKPANPPPSVQLTKSEYERIVKGAAEIKAFPRHTRPVAELERLRDGGALLIWPPGPIAGMDCVPMTEPGVDGAVVIGWRCRQTMPDTDDEGLTIDPPDFTISCRLMLKATGELTCMGHCEHGACRKLLRLRPGGASLTCACVFRTRPVPVP
jgi:hypothetical protein